MDLNILCSIHETWALYVNGHLITSMPKYLQDTFKEHAEDFGVKLIDEVVEIMVTEEGDSYIERFGFPMKQDDLPGIYPGNYKTINHIKPSNDEYYFKMLEVISLRSGCSRGRASCLFVKNDDIVATGFSATTPGQPDCDELGHEFITTIESGELHKHCVRCMHAEQMAIARAVKNRISLKGTTLYVSFTPCMVCARMIALTGCVAVVAWNQYQSQESVREVLVAAGISLRHINEKIQDYSN